MAAINRCNCPLAQDESQYQFVVNYTKLVGDHTLKVGADIDASSQRLAEVFLR